MSNTDKEYIDLCLVSILKVSRRYNSVQELAKTLLDTLGIFDASEIASYIKELEELELKNGHNQVEPN